MSVFNLLQKFKENRFKGSQRIWRVVNIRKNQQKRSEIGLTLKAVKRLFFEPCFRVFNRSTCSESFQKIVVTIFANNQKMFFVKFFNLNCKDFRENGIIFYAILCQKFKIVIYGLIDTLNIGDTFSRI